MNKLIGYKLKNAAGMEVEILNFGARLAQIWWPQEGQLKPMLVSYKTMDDFIDDEFYLGASCGRVCNRIANAEFELNGKLYTLDQNDGANTLHGGSDNLSYQYWQAEEVTETYIRLSYTSADGEGGFPGQLKVQVEYTLTADNALEIQFTANTDKTTPVNLTNHAYFNLSEDNAKGLHMSLESEQFIERSGNGVPTGELLASDLISKELKRGQQIEAFLRQSTYQQVKDEEGLDHSFVLDAELPKPCASLWSQANGIKLEVYTDQPAAQVYTGKFLSGEFEPYQGVCIECHGYVDAINHPHFPSIIVEPEQTYRNFICYRFSDL